MRTNAQPPMPEGVGAVQGAKDGVRRGVGATQGWRPIGRRQARARNMTPLHRAAGDPPVREFVRELAPAIEPQSDRQRGLGCREDYVSDPARGSCNESLEQRCDCLTCHSPVTVRVLNAH